MDICIQTPMKKLESMHMLAEVLANSMSDSRDEMEDTMTD